MKLGNWHKVPHVRSGDQLTIGERSADKLKAAFGSWTFIILLNAIIVGWIVVNACILRKPFDPFPFILLNLGLSWLAAQQGGALQIAANRGDRISSEVALHTYQNGQELLGLNKQQLDILGRLDGLQTQVARIGETMADHGSQVSQALADHTGQLGEVSALITQIAAAPAPSGAHATDAEAVRASNAAAEVRTAQRGKRNSGAKDKTS